MAGCNLCTQTSRRVRRSITRAQRTYKQDRVARCRVESRPSRIPGRCLQNEPERWLASARTNGQRSKRQPSEVADVPPVGEAAHQPGTGPTASEALHAGSTKPVCEHEIYTVRQWRRAGRMCDAPVTRRRVVARTRRRTALLWHSDASR